MKIDVGVRLTVDDGLTFFGIEEVNCALAANGRIVSIEPGGALFREVLDEDKHIRHALSGFIIRVVIAK